MFPPMSFGSYEKGIENPKRVKEKLASIIVEDLYDGKHADEAKKIFDTKHSPGRSLEERIKENYNIDEESLLDMEG